MIESQPLHIRQANEIADKGFKPSALESLMKTISRDVFNTGWTISFRIYGYLKEKNERD